MTNPIRKVHNIAMDYAEIALVAKIKKQEGWQEMFNQNSLLAFENELAAVNLLLESDTPESQPTRAILCRSAACLALDCNKPDEAITLATLGGVANPYTELSLELAEVLDKAKQMIEAAK